VNPLGTSRVAGDLTAAVKAVVDAAHELAAAGLVAGTSGNLSARCGEVVVVSATGARLRDLEADQVTVVDLAGHAVSGRLAPTSELALHLEVYRRFGPGSVVHAHPPVATALACVLDELPCIHPDMLELGGAVRVAPYRLFGSRAFADVTAQALSGRQAALMSNHGTVALGDDPGQAVERTRLLEWAAGLYFRGSQLGTPRVLSDEEQQELRATIERTGYGRVHPREP
jgi:L-fuculose-phosphate aldolase